MIPLVFMFANKNVSAAEQDIEADITYECNVEVSILDLDFDMDTTIYASAPETVAPGEVASATDSYLDAWVPEEIVGTINDLLQADSIEGEASLFEVHAENLDDTVNVADPAIPIEETPVPDEGALQLTVPADGGLEAGPFEAGQEGEVVFSAGDIYVELAPTNNPTAVMEASCTPADGEDTTLATVDIDEDGGSEPDPDPVGSIELEGDEEMELEVGEEYDEPGFTVVDEDGNDITDEVDVNVDGDVDTTTEGTYELTYSVEGNDEIESVTRTVNVVDPDGEDPPEDPVGSIELEGDEEMELEVGEEYDEPGFTVVDEDGNDITDEVDVNVEGDVDTTTAGTYELTYSIEGNDEIEPVTRTVTVVDPDGEDPAGSIELEGNEEMELEVGEDFEDPGFTVIDEDGNDITDEVDVSVEGDVDTSTEGTYELTYSVEDNDEIDSVTRTVHVVEPDGEDPPEDIVGTIELEGNEEMELEVDEDFEDPGFTVVDEDGNDITDEVDVNVEGDVDTTTEGTYELTYSVEGNDEIDSVTRTVTVVESDDGEDPEDPAAGNFLSGAGSPDEDLGEVDDHYLDTEAMELYVKEEDGWNSLGVLRGEDGESGDQGPPGEDGSMWFTGEGEPGADLGVEGDLYLDEDSGDVYQKEDGEWGKIANLQGPLGDCDCLDDNGGGNGSGTNGSNGSGGSNGSNGSSNGSNGSLNGDNGLGIGNNDNDRDNENGSGYNGGNGYTGENGSDFDRDRDGGVLPETAGHTPLMILIGSLLVIAGGALLVRRKLSLA